MNLKPDDSIRIKKSMQGAPVVNNGYVEQIGENVVAISIDLRSKYCDVISSFSSSNGSCGVLLAANERSLYLHKTKERDSFTQIEFPDFKNWSVFAWYLGRYTLNVCLVNKNVKEPDVSN